MSLMDSSKGDEIDYEIYTLIKVYKDGRVERFLGTEVVPPSIDPHSPVQSKDLIIFPQTNLSARLYLPTNNNTLQKLPLLIYFHGGGFLIESAFSPTYHNHLNSLVSHANVVVLSLNYRLAPEHPLPTAYNDSWEAIQWVGSHSINGMMGSESWLSDYVDFDRVFLGGDSAGANIAHNMALRAGDSNLTSKIKLLGVVLIHPYFWGEERIGSEGIVDTTHKEMAEKMWLYSCPSTTGFDDPLINPIAVGAPSLSGLGCSRMLVCVAEKDMFRDRGWLYYETLKKSSDWGGVVDIVEAEGEDHVFHLLNPTSDKALILLKRLAEFLEKQ